MQKLFSKTLAISRSRLVVIGYSPSKNPQKPSKTLANLGPVAPRLEDIGLEEDLAVAVQDALEVSHQASLPWTRWHFLEAVWKQLSHEKLTL